MPAASRNCNKMMFASKEVKRLNPLIPSSRTTGSRKYVTTMMHPTHKVPYCRSFTHFKRSPLFDFIKIGRTWMIWAAYSSRKGVQIFSDDSSSQGKLASVFVLSPAKEPNHGTYNGSYATWLYPWIVMHPYLDSPFRLLFCLFSVGMV